MGLKRGSTVLAYSSDPCNGDYICGTYYLLHGRLRYGNTVITCSSLSTCSSSLSKIQHASLKLNSRKSSELETERKCLHTKRVHCSNRSKQDRESANSRIASTLLRLSLKISMFEYIILFWLRYKIKGRLFWLPFCKTKKHQSIYSGSCSIVDISIFI